MYAYPSYVNAGEIEALVEEEKNLRYLLKIPLADPCEKSVLVIMKNPSVGDHLASDHTLLSVLRFCRQKRYGTVYVMNLYAYRTQNPKIIGELIKNKLEREAIGEKNDVLIRTISGAVDDVIVGWGTNTFQCTPNYKRRIKDVSLIIQKQTPYYVQSVAGNGWYPRHPQVWHTRKPLPLVPWSMPFNYHR